MNATIAQELYFLIFKFLDSGPCRVAAEAIKQEIETYNLLPKRIDWLGREHELDFNTFQARNTHIRNDFLLKIVSRIGDLLNHQIPPSILSVNTLLASGSQSLLRTSSDITHHNESHFLFSRLHNAPLKPSSQKVHHYSQNIVNILNSRQACGSGPISFILPTHTYERFIRCKRVLGHLACVYCVSFDRTGRYIFTGADDMLIKIWSAEDSRLLATLRGHSGEITDITVNYENTLLAAGSCDKMIRVWCLKTTQPICVLTGHNGMITSLKFCPYSKKDDRYLVSTSNDGTVCFWKWNVKTRQFDPQPIRFIERIKNGAHLICFSFSTGGSFLAVGSSDHYVRVFHVSSPSGPTKVLQIDPHLDQVDSLQFSNTGLRFVSGSKDGTANIWHYERQEWHSKTLQMSATLSNVKASPNDQHSSIKLKVTMVGWSLDDAYVITAVNDHSIKIWESNSGKLKHILREHDDEVFVIEAHPTDSRIFLSGGHDGKIFLWDIETGKHIKMFYNQITGQGYGAIFDCKWSPDGSRFACTDSHGHLTIFGFGDDEKYKRVPDEVFFHTDYRPLIRDANHYVIDEQTQCAPHLMPPPFLVDIDGNPYPPALQRLVPGRENCKDDQLVPYIAIQNERGVAEVLDPRDNNQDNPQPSGSNGDSNIMNSTLNQSALNNSNVANSSFGNDSQQRPTIDDMIERLQQEQQSQQARIRVNEEHGYAASGSSSAVANNNGINEPSLQPAQRLMPAVSESLPNNRPGVRRSGDVEGVRQSVGNWQSRGGNVSVARGQRAYVFPLPKEEVASTNRKLARFNEYEEESFIKETKKKPIPVTTAIKEMSNKGRLTRRKKQMIAQRRGIRPNNNRSAANLSMNQDEDPSIQSDDSDDTSYSVGRAESWQESSSSSQNDSDSSDDEWQFSRTDPRSGRTKRKKQRSAARGIGSDSDEQQQPVRSSVRRNRETNRHPMEIDENQPSTSSGVVASKSKITRGVNRALKQEQMLNNHAEELYKPPEWLTEVTPKRTPYFPQIGDEVIYFRKGHALYVDAVRRNKVYTLHQNKQQPLHNKNVADQQLVKIKEISYEIKPPNMVVLTMQIIDEETMEETGEHFKLMYHDMPDVIDFLVLKQFYDISVQREWKPNDRFKSIIDNKWWFGTIKCIEQDDEYPECEFQNIRVVWDNKDEESMSVWDLEPCSEQEQNQDQLPDSLPISDEELERLMYVPKREDWPECGRDSECDRLIRGLEKIMETSWAESFNAPVDLNEYPLYAKLIAYPVDLSTIKARLENRFYRSIEAVKFDVSFIEHNAREFNEAYSMITRDAKIVTYMCSEFINRHDFVDINVIQQEIQQNKDMFESTESEFEEEEDHCVVTRKGKQCKKGPRWITECKEMLHLLFHNVDSEPFRTAVDLNEYEDYLTKVNTPMDLNTIREQLTSGCYNDPKDLNRDLKLIFSNSKLYNTDHRSQIYTMTLRLQSFANEHMKTILNNYKQEQQNLINKQQAKSKRNKKLVNGKTNVLQERRISSRHRNTDAQPSTSSSRYQTAGPASYSNGHTSSNQRSSRRRQILKEEEDEEEDEEEEEEEEEEDNSEEEKQDVTDDDDYKPYSNQARRTKRKRAVVQQSASSEATEEEEEEEEEPEEPFNVSLEGENTELDDETEDDDVEEDEEEVESDEQEINYGRRSNRQSNKRKRRRQARKSSKKIKLTNGNSSRGRKASLVSESDQVESQTDEDDDSATDLDSSGTILNNSGSSSSRTRGRTRKDNPTASSSSNRALKKTTERYTSRSSRRKRVNYRELNGSDYENEYDQQTQTCTSISSRGRPIKRTEVRSF